MTNMTKEAAKFYADSQEEIDRYANAYINGLISWGAWPALLYIAIENRISELTKSYDMEG